MRPIDADALFDALRDNEFQTFCPLDEVDDVIAAAPTIESTCSQVSKALCGKENASLDEILQAVEELKEAAMLEWLNPEIELPPDEDHAVLCCVNDRYGNTEFVNAFLLGFYDDSEGWSLEQYPEWESPNVTHWMPLPKEPKENMADENALPQLRREDVWRERECLTSRIEKRQHSETVISWSSV